jgi:hypothetical protein
MMGTQPYQLVDTLLKYNTLIFPTRSFPGS